MDKITKTFDFLQIPNPFRDVIITISGVGFLFLIQVFLKINLFSKINSYGFGRIETDLLFLAAGFVMGKVLIIIESIIQIITRFLLRIFIFLFLNKNPLKRSIGGHINDWKRNWKEKIREYLLAEKYNKSVSYNEVKNSISAIEVAEVMSKNPSLGTDLERLIYQQLFCRTLLSVTLLLMIFISKVYVLFFILMLYLNFTIRLSMRGREYIVFKGIVKIKGKIS